MKVERIEINKIVCPENIRGDADKNIASLMSSIQQHGLQEPIGVDYDNQGKYRIVYGNRRLSAAFKLGWKTIPAVIYNGLNDVDFLIHNATENLQREQISPAELGRVCEQLEEKGLSVPQMSARLNTPESAIKTVLNLYKTLPINLRNKVFHQQRGQKKNGRLNVSGATRIINMKEQYGMSKKDFLKVFEYSSAHNLSTEKIKIIGGLIKEGLSFNMALKRVNDYDIYRMDCVAFADEVRELAKKANCTPNAYVCQIVYGLKPPITKPTFVSFQLNPHNRFVNKKAKL
jgi:ParB/RepB/Spo0J family partition protein